MGTDTTLAAGGGEGALPQGDGNGSASARLSDELLRVLKKEASRSAEKGLVLVDMPTGYGKSYAAQELIGSFVLDPDNEGRRIFYITPQKKNLPDDDAIRRSFAHAGAPSVPRHAVMRVMPLHEMLAETASWGRLGSLPDAFARSRELDGLVRAADGYRCAMEGEGALPELVEVARGRLGAAERAFRAKAERALDAAGARTAEQRLRLIEDDADWAWLGELYPTAFTRRARAFLMSVDKFVYNHVSLVERPFRFVESPLVRDAVVLIDEFDASKGDLLDKAVQDAVATKVDLTSLVRAAHATFRTKERPLELVRDSERRSGAGRATMAEMLDGARRVVADAYDRAELRYEYKTEGGLTSSDFLFYDFQYDALCGGDYRVVTDEAERVNLIVPSGAHGAKGGPLTPRIGSMRGAARYLQGVASALALNYQQRRSQVAGPLGSVPDLDSARRTVLDCLGITDPEQQRYMLEGMRAVAGRWRSGDGAASRGDLSVYAQGLHFVGLTDDDAHGMRTRLEMCAVQGSPESVMLELMGRCVVIGLSATATVDSVLCNFDIGYLDVQSGGRVRRVSGEDRRRMEEAYVRQSAGYAQVDIRTAPVRAKDGLEGWQDALGDAEAARVAWDALQAVQEDRRPRYLRLALAFRHFLEHPEAGSMLALTMAAPGEAPGRALEKDVLKSVLEVTRLAVAPADDTALRFLGGSRSFERDRAEMHKLLASGRRAFVVAAYATVGTGVNLQYPVPPGVRTVEVYPQGNGAMKDFDAIYLDRPTNLAPYPRASGEAEFIRDLFEVCELCERGEISLGTRRQATRAIGKAHAGGKGFCPSLGSTPSARAKAARIVNQALGRICRTGHKSPTIHVLFDERLAESMDLRALDGCMVNQEYEALVRHLEEISQREGPETDALTARARLVTTRLNSRLQGIVRRGTWNGEAIELWGLLRRTALARPTAPSGTDDRLVANTYVRLPRSGTSYTFSQEGDFGEVDVSFDPSRPLRSEVSASAARLRSLALLPPVAQRFQENGWPLSWEPGELILSPVLFRNIYLGALGEQAGKALVEAHLPGVALEEIDDPRAFEKFDFRVAGTGTYVDFKHWAAPSGRSEGEVAEWILSKMEAIGAERALVCNVLGPAGSQYAPRTLAGGRILTVPLLADEDGTLAAGMFLAIERWLGKEWGDEGFEA